MDRQIRFDEEVIKKIGCLNSRFEKLEDLLSEISDPEYADEIEFIAKDARNELDRILSIMNQVLAKLDDRE